MTFFGLECLRVVDFETDTLAGVPFWISMSGSIAATGLVNCTGKNWLASPICDLNISTNRTVVS